PRSAPPTPDGGRWRGQPRGHPRPEVAALRERADLPSPSEPLEGLEVAVHLPAGDLHPVLVPLLGLGLDEPLEDVVAERVADDLVGGQLVDRLSQRPGQLPNLARLELRRVEVVEVLL